MITIRKRLIPIKKISRRSFLKGFAAFAGSAFIAKTTAAALDENVNKEIPDDFKESNIYYNSNHAWTVNGLTAKGEINNDYDALGPVTSLKECSTIIVRDGCRCHIAYFSDYNYIGKVGANGSINQTPSDWKDFTGEVAIKDIAPYIATHFICILIPTDGTVLTESLVSTWANAHCFFMLSNIALLSQNTEDMNNEVDRSIYSNPNYPGFINYGYDTPIYLWKIPNAEDEQCVAVIRHGTRLIIDGQSPSGQLYVILSGKVIRSMKSDVLFSLNSGIELKSGHSYRIYWKLLSGNVIASDGMQYPSVSAYPIGSTSPVGHVVYGKCGYRDFNYTEVPINLVFFTNSAGIMFEKAEYIITLEDLSLRDGIEEYFIPELKDTIDKINNLNNEPALVFPFVTDIHRYSSSYQNFDKTIANIRAFTKNIKCDFIINTGDSTDGTKSKGETLVYDYEITKELNSIGIPYLFANGNHDNNPYYSDGSQLFNLSETYKGLYAATKDVISNISENGTDYYVDFKHVGVRVICLNSSNNSVSSKHAYGASTADWLAEALSTQSRVILFEHASSIPEQNWRNDAPKNHEAISHALQEFVHKGGTLVQLSGHTHGDVAFISPWLAVVQTCQKLVDYSGDLSGFDVITGNIDMIRYPLRKPGTVSEDAWSACIYKPISNILHIIRFGAGSDRHFHATHIAPTTLSTLLYGSIAWASSDTNIAVVSNGVVEGVSSGTCAILAYDEEENYECWIIDVP